MWSFQSNQLDAPRGRHFTLHHGVQPASFDHVVRGWREDRTFRSLFNAALAEAEFAAFRWETPAVTASHSARPFEFVLLDSPGLAQHPDPNPFQRYFGKAIDGVVVFSNLGGDATLVVPCPMAEPAVYGHLGAFVRLAPERQQQALWQAVGNAMARRIGANPVWLSTAGAGVSWLHVRLDDRPKYYGYSPFRKSTAAAES